ncbi:MAG: type II toxin-antitoxin system VapC family toxin [Candidatus Cryptobacteroides sp.]
MEAVRIFIDTYIVLDYLTGRMGDGQAKTIVQIGQDPKFELCISMLTAVNVLYFSKKYAPALQPADLARLFHILPQDYQQYCDAQTLDLSDFEDALQVSCALRSGCLLAISRDHHFRAAPIVSFTPEEFIAAVVQG